MVSLQTGIKIVKLARQSVEAAVKEKKFVLKRIDDNEFKEKRGLFVTLEEYPNKNLRGCIGFPSATFPIWEAAQKAAYAAAFEDFRFNSLKKEELKKIIFEVSIMTKPELIKVKKPEEYCEKIEKNKDGLILVNRSCSGLFLPQVWYQLPSTEEFLENLCMKAGLTSDYWLDKETKIYKFRVQAFKETEPEGKIIEVKL